MKFINWIIFFNDVNISKRSGKTAWYRGPTVMEALASLPVRVRPQAPFRFPVQDIYPISGKNVAVGRVVSGVCAAGEAVSVYPHRLGSRIKKIWIFGENRKKASAMENIGITLSSGGPGLKRGDLICGVQDPPELLSTLNAHFFWMSRTPLKKGQQVTLRCATQETGGVVQGITRRINTSTLELVENDSDELFANEACQLDLKLEKPIVAEDFNRAEELGRFVTENGDEITGFGMVKTESLRQSSSGRSPRR